MCWYEFWREKHPANEERFDRASGVWLRRSDNFALRPAKAGNPSKLS